MGIVGGALQAVTAAGLGGSIRVGPMGIVGGALQAVTAAGLGGSIRVGPGREKQQTKVARYRWGRGEKLPGLDAAWGLDADRWKRKGFDAGPRREIGGRQATGRRESETRQAGRGGREACT
jgi:hypothetical protein